jgi:hypothetical protein
VRRLSDHAGELRDSIDALDDQLAAFDRGDDGLNDAERGRVAGELRASRTLAAERLAATVAAIENVRLDLLRLQMGSAGIESVTASLDAARYIGQQISDSLDAQQQVERLLLQATPDLAPHRSPPSAADVVPDDDDADTPVSGVPATSG